MVQATDNAVLNGAMAKGMKKEVATLTLETLMESHLTSRHYILLSCCKKRELALCHCLEQKCEKQQPYFTFKFLILSPKYKICA